VIQLCLFSHASQVYSFDSFLGLPGDWFEHKQGAFERGGSVPPAERNVRFYKGWFNETLPALASELRSVHQQFPDLHLKAALVFIDCDLYESTVDALFGLQWEGLLQRGTILAFDELIHHPSAFGTSGELAALYELLLRHPRPIQILAGAWRRSTMEVGGGAVLGLL